MPSTQFCGLSVRDFRGGLGLGRNQKSYLQVNMVQDGAHGEIPAPPLLGTPVYFQFYDYRFFGLLQKWSKKQDVNGLPTFEAVCEDPRDILEATEVIIGQYNGGSFGLPNLLNAYGWYESVLGYGTSGSNSEGMSWNNILFAINNLLSTTIANPYGGLLNYKGILYNVDLTELPIPPSQYRIQGNGASANLLEMISQVCEDGGCDFYVELDGFTIVVHTISRVVQPPLGTIAALTSDNFGGTLIRSEDGLEARNEMTSAFLVGGAVTGMHLTNVYRSFWGHDISGNPIVGKPGVVNVSGLLNVPCDLMTLNASPIADVFGSVNYPCSTLELRCAKYSHSSWLNYISSQRPDVAALVIPEYKKLDGIPGKAMGPDIVQADRPNALKLTNTDFQVLQLKQAKLYDFVKGYAEEFFNRKFIVSLPFVLTKQDSETLIIQHSQEITDAGWFGEGESPLALTPLNEDVFKSQDGRFVPFVKFVGLGNLDTTTIPTADSVIQDDALYVKCQVEPNLIFTTDGYPNAVVTLGGSLSELAADMMGGTEIWGALAGVGDEGVIAPLLKNNFMQTKIWPKERAPSAFAIPLKSNILTYGPWLLGGAPGKTRCEYDSGLVPWNYGGEAELEAAALSRVSTAITNMQISEAGQIELAGPPSVSLGRVLREGGPNLTSIEVGYGTQGVITNYKFQSFTPKFRTFAKTDADKIRRAGLVGQEMRRSLRQQVVENAEKAQTLQGAAAERGFLINATKRMKRESPHDTLVSYQLEDDNGDVRIQISSADYEEAITLSNADNDSEYANTAVCNITSVLRPYSTGAGTGLIPNFVDPDLDFPEPLTSANLNPLKDTNDIEVYSSGSTYNDLHVYRNSPDADNSRGFGLRGPVIVSGWGYDTDLLPVPGNGGVDFLANFLKRSDEWKTGPVDLLWDERRGVWTCHDVVIGTVNGDIDKKGDGEIVVSNGDQDTTWTLAVTNWSQSKFKDGDEVFAAYVFSANKWYVLSGTGGECPLLLPFVSISSASTVNLNDYDCAVVYRITNATSAIITIVPSNTDGQAIALVNTTTTLLSLVSGGNISLPGGFTINIQPSGGILLWYDSTSNKWRTLSMESGGPTGSELQLLCVQFNCNTGTASPTTTSISYVNGRKQALRDAGC